MSIETRLAKIEATAAASLPTAADQAYNDYFAAMIVIAYDTDDEAERDARIAALGPSPIATNSDALKFERDLMMVYSEPDTMKPVGVQGAL